MNGRAREALQDSDIWFPTCRGDIAHHLIALAGEVGEICNIYKKWDRSGVSSLPVSTQAEMGKELIDVLVYAFNLAGEMNLDIDAAYDEKRKFNHERFAPADVPFRAGTDA
jgi:NTP pyrophosphatase (non-canonical NTP hydrolase)